MKLTINDLIDIVIEQVTSYLNHLSFLDNVKDKLLRAYDVGFIVAPLKDKGYINDFEIQCEIHPDDPNWVLVTLAYQEKPKDEFKILKFTIG